MLLCIHAIQNCLNVRNCSCACLPNYDCHCHNRLNYYIIESVVIESVDSICRDSASADTQYMLIQTNLSKSPKQLTYKPVITPYRSSSSVFMTNNKPSGAKKHRVSTKPESHQTAKMFFFLLLQFLCYHPYLVSMLFADLLSCYI